MTATSNQRFDAVTLEIFWRRMISAVDEGAKALVEKAWGDQRGASFFFVVARASPDGGAQKNQELSQPRAEAVLNDAARMPALLWRSLLSENAASGRQLAPCLNR